MHEDVAQERSDKINKDTGHVWGRRIDLWDVMQCFHCKTTFAPSKVDCPKNLCPQAPKEGT